MIGAGETVGSHPQAATAHNKSITNATQDRIQTMVARPTEDIVPWVLDLRQGSRESGKRALQEGFGFQTQFSLLPGVWEEGERKEEKDKNPYTPP